MRTRLWLQESSEQNSLKEPKRLRPQAWAESALPEEISQRRQQSAYSQDGVRYGPERDGEGIA
jgi:hypothetical protein